MNRDELLETVIKSDALPTLPNVATKLIALVSKEETTLQTIAELISQDVALTTKILKVSNSAFYNFRQQISSINQAVSILGMNAVRSLVLSFSFFTMRAGKKKSLFKFTQFWERSLTAAVSAKLILEKVNGANTEEIFISGLLQNLGELILAKTIPEQYDRILQQAEEKKKDIGEIELEQLGIQHNEVGYEVAKRWGFPEALLKPMLYQNDPDAYQEDNRQIDLTIKAVYLSNLLTNILFSDTPQEYHKKFQEDARRLLQLTPEDIESILSDVHFQVEQAGKYFDLKTKNTKSVQEILQEANIRLSLLNLDYDQINKELVQAKIALEKMTKELEKKNRRLDNLVNLDGLTNIYNHRYFQTTLDQEINRATRSESFLSLLLIDIDHFKDFNDKYGHQTGDFILVEFSQLLKKHLRTYDVLARYGGEEFAVILPETTESEALTVAEKLHAIINAATFEKGHNNYSLTASFGCASCQPSTDDDFSKNNFIAQADEALYTAKNNGRNRIEKFTTKKKWFSFK